MSARQARELARAVRVLGRLVDDTPVGRDFDLWAASQALDEAEPVTQAGSSTLLPGSDGQGFTRRFWSDPLS